eukprot:1196069-Prorocentrum_minimum.AAC.1
MELTNIELADQSGEGGLSARHSAASLPARGGGRRGGAAHAGGGGAGGRGGHLRHPHNAGLWGPPAPARAHRHQLR